MTDTLSKGKPDVEQPGGGWQRYGITASFILVYATISVSICPLLPHMLLLHCLSIYVLLSLCFYLPVQHIGIFAGTTQPGWADCLLTDCIREPQCHGAHRAGGVNAILSATHRGHSLTTHMFLSLSPLAFSRFLTLSLAFCFPAFSHPVSLSLTLSNSHSYRLFLSPTRTNL